MKRIRCREHVHSVSVFRFDEAEVRKLLGVYKRKGKIAEASFNGYSLVIKVEEVEDHKNKSY